MRWPGAIWRRHAAWRSRPRVCIRTIPPCTCCSVASRSRRGGVRTRWKSCGAPCGSIPWASRPTGCWATRWSPSAGSPRPWTSGLSGSAWRRARRRSWRGSTTCAGRARPPRPSPARGRMADDVKKLSAELALAHGGEGDQAPATGAAEPMAPAPAAQPLEEARVFAGLEGAEEGLLLLDPSGQVLGGALKDPAGRDVTDAVAAYLAGVSQEAARAAKLLGLGRWTGLAAEGRHGHAHLTPPTGSALLLVVRERAVPMGRLAIIAQRAALAARRWLEAQG